MYEGGLREIFECMCVHNTWGTYYVLKNSKCSGYIERCPTVRQLTPMFDIFIFAKISVYIYLVFVLTFVLMMLNILITQKDKF